MKIEKGKKYQTKNTSGGYKIIKVLALKKDKVKIKENISATNIPFWINYWVSKETFFHWCKPFKN